MLFCSNTLLFFKLLSLVVCWSLNFEFEVKIKIRVRARVTVWVKYKVGVRARIEFFLFVPWRANKLCCFR